MNNISWYNTNECSSRGMKYSIGEKQVKVVTMKKFLIFIFSMFGLFVGWIAIMVYSYQRSYNEWKSSRSESRVTYPVEKYSTSSSSTKYYDYKKYSSSSSSTNSSSSTKYYDYKNSNEYTDAYVKALFLSEKSHFSKQKIEQDLTRRHSEDASQYAITKLNIDWKEQALLKAKSYQEFHYSKEKLIELLVNLDLFTQEEADYAIEQGHFDWKEEAVKQAEFYANGGKITKERLLQKLVEYRRFTQEEAEYAIEHAKIDWSD